MLEDKTRDYITSVHCSIHIAAHRYIHYISEICTHHLTVTYIYIFSMSCTSLCACQERIFAFSYLLLAYLLAVVFISFITSAMTRLHLITGVQSAHQRVLRWFLIDARPLHVRLCTSWTPKSLRTMAFRGSSLRGSTPT